MIRMVLAAAALAAAPSLAFAADGCAAFKWPVDTERAALLAAKTALPVPNGGTLPYGAAVKVTLAPMEQAGLPEPPERAPKFDDTKAGHFALPAPAKAGLYRITLDREAWVDVLDNGEFLKSRGFSGATGCEGARKVVRFDFPARALTIQLSGAREGELSAIVTPAE